MRYSNGSMITTIYQIVAKLSKPDSGLSLSNNSMTNEQTQTWEQEFDFLFYQYNPKNDTGE